MQGERVTVPDFGRMKKRGEKIAMLTGYDFLTAKLLDEADTVSYTHLTLPTN